MRVGHLSVSRRRAVAWTLAAALAAGCAEPWNDRELTGIEVSPAPGERLGPVDLRVRNRGDEAVVCDAWETDDCPSLARFFTELERLEPGELIEIDTIECTFTDVLCRFPDDPPDVRPVRAWGWSITPPTDDE